MGLIKLDVGHYQLDPQAACQRYRQNDLDATSTIRNAVASVREGLQNLAAAFSLQFAPARV